jgi:hypothetical protein
VEPESVRRKYRFADQEGQDLLLRFLGSLKDLKTAIATSTNMPTAAMQAGIFTRQITDPLAPRMDA